MEAVNNVNYDLWIQNITNIVLFKFTWYDLFEERIGKIERMDFVETEWFEGKITKSIRVKFVYWYDNDYNKNMLDEIKSKNSGTFRYPLWIYGRECEGSVSVFISINYVFEEECEYVVKSPGYYVVNEKRTNYIYDVKNTKIVPLPKDWPTDVCDLVEIKL